MELVQIVDAAMAEAVQKSGAWVVCRIGCYECCKGPFPISALDAERLSAGLAELAAHDPQRAAGIVARAGAWAGGDDDPCPALDPESGACDLYAARPLTCRTFGPPVRCASGAIAICELCFDGATEDEIAACVVDLDVAALDSSEGDDELTVAAALSGSWKGTGCLSQS